MLVHLFFVLVTCVLESCTFAVQKSNTMQSVHIKIKHVWNSFTKARLKQKNRSTLESAVHNVQFFVLCVVVQYKSVYILSVHTIIGPWPGPAETPATPRACLWEPLWAPVSSQCCWGQRAPWWPCRWPDRRCGAAAGTRPQSCPGCWISQFPGHRCSPASDWPGSQGFEVWDREHSGGPWSL